MKPLKKMTFGDQGPVLKDKPPVAHRVSPSSPYPRGVARAAAHAVRPGLTTTVTYPGPFPNGNRTTAEGCVCRTAGELPGKCCHRASQTHPAL